MSSFFIYFSPCFSFFLLFNSFIYIHFLFPFHFPQSFCTTRCLEYDNLTLSTVAFHMDASIGAWFVHETNLTNQRRNNVDKFERATLTMRLLQRAYNIVHSNLNVTTFYLRASTRYNLQLIAIWENIYIHTYSRGQWTHNYKYKYMFLHTFLFVLSVMNSTKTKEIISNGWIILLTSQRSEINYISLYSIQNLIID